MLHWLANLAAIGPPGFKSPLYLRVFGKITRGRKFRVRSNLGIDSKLRWSVPVDRPALAFGNPMNDQTEASALQVTRALAGGCDAFVDVGANRGLFSLWALGHFPKIVAIEADPQLSKELRTNIDAAAVNIELIAAAVSDRQGMLTFYVDQDSDLMGSAVPVYSDLHRLQKIDVPAMALSELLNERDFRRAFLKIDVEGYGSTVWQGLRPAAGRVRGLVLEVTGPEASEGLPRRVIEDTGWHAYYLRGSELIPSAKGEFDYVHPYWNWLFVQESPTELAPLLRDTGLRISAAS